MNRQVTPALLFGLTLLMPGFAYARRTETGFLDRTVTVAGETYRYQVFVPANFDTQPHWPVVLFLHGYGERGSDGLLQTDVGIGHAIRTWGGRIPFVVVLPQCRAGEHLWVDAAMQQQALAALDASIREFHGDTTRVYLTGISMGGYGVWDLAAKYPHRFAALVPICGGIRDSEGIKRLHVAAADEAGIADPYAETARRIGRTPVWIFHGTDDETVPVEESRKMADALRAAGGNVKYTEYPGTGHDSWDKAYAEAGFVDWLLSQHL